MGDAVSDSVQRDNWAALCQGSGARVLMVNNDQPHSQLSPAYSENKATLIYERLGKDTQTPARKITRC